MRPRPAVLVAFIAVAVATACGDNELEDAAVAAAKCGNAVHDELGMADSDTSLRTSAVQVTDLNDGKRRVEGSWANGSAKSGTYRCDVAPDATDRLRGLRVTDLIVKPRM